MTCLIYDKFGQLLDIQEFNSTKEQEIFEQKNVSWVVKPCNNLEESFLISENWDTDNDS